jgi:large subunit ribosomal protein L11
MKEKINLIVDAGKANLGQQASRINSLGFNANEIQKEINEKTKEFSGLKVNVTLILDKEKKTYEIKVKAPSIAELVKKELGVELLKLTEEDKQKGKTFVGNLSMKQVEKIAKIKAEEMGEKDLKKVLRMVISSIDTMQGVLIEEKKPKELLKGLTQ